MLKLVVVIVLLCAVSCGYRKIDELQFGPNEYRCASDGFCLQPTGNYSLQAAFRQGIFEIRVDVVDAQTQYGGSQQNFAVLVSDQHDNPLMVSDSGRIPKNWLVRHQNSHAVKHISEFTAERDIREKLTRNLMESLQRKGNASDIGRENAYLLARQIIEDIVERNESFQSGDVAPIPKRWKKKTYGKNDSSTLIKSFFPLISPTYGTHDLQEALAVGSFHASGRDDSAYRQLQQQFQPLVSGGFLDGYADDRSEYVSVPFIEFHQTVYLWRKPAPAMMRIYPFQGAEHSASGIILKYRGFDTQYLWMPFLDTRTHNHGTEAEATGMDLYAFCDMYPSTTGHYAWKGDCQGRWGFDHVCNDDTTMQLFHAAGNWSGGRYCPMTHRKLAPYCDAVWDRNGSRVFVAGGIWGQHF